MAAENSQDWGVDVTGRMMRYEPWLTDDEGKYTQPSETEIKAVYGCSGEAVRETLLYFEECEGDTQALINLLNEHVTAKKFHTGREELLTASRWYTNEYYFYFIMFTKKVMGRYDFRYGEKKPTAPVSVHHKFYELGFLDYVPFGDVRNQDITNAVPFTIMKGYEALGVDFSDMIIWIDVLAARKTSLTYRNDLMKVENAWFCAELMYFNYEFFKILSNDNDIHVVVQKCFDKYNLAGFSFMPEGFLLKAMEIIINKTTNVVRTHIKRSGNHALVDISYTSDYDHAKHHNYNLSVNVNVSSLISGVFLHIVKKLLKLEELPVLSEMRSSADYNKISFTMEWKHKKSPIPFLWLLLINTVGVAAIIILHRYIPFSAYSVLALIALNAVAFLLRQNNIIRRNKKAGEEQFHKILLDYEHRLDDVASISQNVLNEKQQLIDAKEEAERRLKITEIYTRRSLVEIIKNGGDPTDYQPSQQNVSILFADIRDFTGISERLEPLDLINFLNKYFDSMNTCIMRNKGEIDKLIGDCIMAVFRDVESATKAALEMRRDLDILNEEQNFLRLEPGKTNVVKIGIGINSGPVVVGNIGSKSKMDYTLIGDIVNVASRCEALTKFYFVSIIISHEVRKELQGDYNIRFLDYIQVKGKERPTRIYELYDCNPPDLIALKKKIQPELNTAFDYYMDGHFHKAGKIYEKLMAGLGEHPYLQGKCADPVINFYHNRCASLYEKQKAGLLREWKGIYEFVEK